MSDTLTKLNDFRFQGRAIPEYMYPGIIRYIENGVLPGDFLQAVISCDMKAACQRADGTNIWLLPAYVAFFYNEVPANCWGSKEAMYTYANSFTTKED